MDRTERFYKIDALLQGGRVVPIGTLLDMLEVSRATFKRDIEYMRDRLNYPIVWDRESGGYRYEQGREGEARGGAVEDGGGQGAHVVVPGRVGHRRVGDVGQRFDLRRPERRVAK